MESLDSSVDEYILDEENSRHALQVLRMKPGEELTLTDGQGNQLQGIITGDKKRECRVKVQARNTIPLPAGTITIAISLLKNTNRFEWFLEKAVEIGVIEIVPLLCERTEKEKFRSDRLKNILISAMLQSRQCWLPILHEPIPFELLFRQEEVAASNQKFIAHCLEGDKKNPADLISPEANSRIVLIGPEGDFSREEIELALRHQFTPLSLGNTRLRSETAGVVAAALLRLI